MFYTSLFEGENPRNKKKKKKSIWSGIMVHVINPYLTMHAHTYLPQATLYPNLVPRLHNLFNVYMHQGDEAIGPPKL